MSANRSFPPSAAAGADVGFGASAPMFDAATAAELLRHRIGGIGARQAGRALPSVAAVESPHRSRPGFIDPHREVLDHMVRRAYSQLVAGDASAARTTLEHALGMAGPVPPGPRAAIITLTSPATRPSQSAGAVDRSPSTASVPRILVRTLGTFEVLVDGVARPEGKKQPRRILALLKAIIALGGKEVCRSTLADALWPELDGDKAQNALTVTLHRLRSYLGVTGAIPVRHGRLSLEPQVVWVDALEFEAAARAVSAVSGCDSVERIFALYRGPFLSADGEEPWAMRQRERLRSRFVSIVAGAGASLEARDRPADAVSVYERGLAADDMAGVFRDGLVRALNKLGGSTEAGPRRASHEQPAAAELG